MEPGGVARRSQEEPGGARGSQDSCLNPPGPPGSSQQNDTKITLFNQQPKTHINIRFLSKILEDFLVDSL